MWRRTFAAAVITGACGWAMAQSYPTHPITLVVGFPPAGGADTVARIVGERLSKALGQPVVIDNKPGAGTTLAATYVARAPADGYTLLMGAETLYGSDQLLYKSAQYDGAKDFTPITRWSSAPMLLAVRKDLAVKSVRDLIDLARQSPGKLTYSSSGIGGSPHLAGLSLAQASGIDMLHVPFKGGAASLQAVTAGDVDMTFGTPPSVLPMAQAGKLRILASTTAERSQLFPEIPGMKESGVDGYDYTFWFGLFGPAGLPPDVAKKLFDASMEALNDPDVQARLQKQGNEVAPSTSSGEFRAWAMKRGERHKELALRAGVTVQ